MFKIDLQTLTLNSILLKLGLKVSGSAAKTSVDFKA